ncbi:hypothetical protein [Thioclava sp. GXIMD4215]|uniref:hypothetical protein n=1 Tax=Thioclava sp. GXIMD4215 TaxID=3131928 RepID=UPI0032466959
MLDRLRLREEELKALKTELAATSAPEEIKMPTLKDLKLIYHSQLVRLESLLTGSDQLIAANAFLTGLIDRVELIGDPDSRDGMRITIISNVGSLFGGPSSLQGVDRQQKSLPREALRLVR